MTTCTIRDYLATFSPDRTIVIDWAYDNPRQVPQRAVVSPDNPEPLYRFRTDAGTDGPNGLVASGVVGEDGVWRWDGQGGIHSVGIGGVNELICWAKEARA